MQETSELNLRQVLFVFFLPNWRKFENFRHTFQHSQFYVVETSSLVVRFIVYIEFLQLVMSAYFGVSTVSIHPRKKLMRRRHNEHKY